MTELFLPEGIYFNLPEDEYHASAALGSNAMKKVAVSPPDFWFTSPHNPVKLESEDSEPLITGRAYHTMVLEGREKFERLYGCARLNGATKAGKEESAAIEAAGKERIKGQQWDRIMLAGAAIRANPHLANAFEGGPTEVSIFWNENDVPKKARIDCLKIRANTDLKTTAPRDESKDFATHCTRNMTTYGYHIQAEHYNDGRGQLSRFIKEGKVFGDHDPKLLSKIALQQEWASVFIFLKKTGAPLTCGISLSPHNPLLDHARNVILKAEANYREFRDKFGYDTPWLTTEPLQELDIDAIPAWSLV